jgi:hypothetical protein
VSGLADRLRARGVADVAAFLAWTQGQTPAPVAGTSDRSLDDIIGEYRQAIGQPAGRRMDPATAHRMVAEGAQRHRDRMLLERVVGQVVREAARAARSQWEHCYQCTPRIPCHKHEGG